MVSLGSYTIEFWEFYKLTTKLQRTLIYLIIDTIYVKRNSASLTTVKDNLKSPALQNDLSHYNI